METKHKERWRVAIYLKNVIYSVSTIILSTWQKKKMEYKSNKDVGIGYRVCIEAEVGRPQP